MKKFLEEFRAFALRGNVIDLAVGVIIGAAFQGIVKSLTDDIISPLLGMAASNDFSAWTMNIAGVEIRYGAFITAIINFVIMALMVFLLVKGMNAMAGRRKKEEQEPAAPTTKKCPFCISEIPIEATRCPNCTSELKE